jgi:hypothetical protein
MKPIFTPTDYVKAAVIKHPSLYASANFETTKFKVFDQLFNTIGNGIKGWHGFVKEIAVRDINLDRAAVFTRGEKIFYGYVGITKLAEVRSSLAFQSILAESEKAEHPEITFWMESSHSDMTLADVCPYPCFDEKYSLLYELDISRLTPEWIQEIIWFYEECQQFFNDDKRWPKYSNAYPNEEKYYDTHVKDNIDRRINECIKAGTIDVLFSEYGVKYTGDLEDFLVRRWNMKHTKIKTFIERTLAKLKAEL